MTVGPVFLTGLSHSGKTPLGMALEASCQIALTRKTYLWPRYLGRFGTLQDEDNRRECLDTILADPSVRRLAPDRGRIEAIFSAGPKTYTRLFAAVHQDHAEQLGLARWADQLKTAERYASTILAEIEDAVFLHLVRDPRDRAGLVSNRPGSLGWETRKWVNSVNLACLNRRCHPGRYHIIAYERLFDDPEGSLRLVSDLVDVAFSDRMLSSLEAGLEAKADVRTLSKRQVEFVTRLASRELTHFGYKTTKTSWASSVMPIESVAAGIRGAAGRRAVSQKAED